LGTPDLIKNTKQFQGLIITAAIFLLGVVSKSRPVPPYRAGEAGNGRDGSHDVMAAVMLQAPVSRRAQAQPVTISGAFMDTIHTVEAVVKSIISGLFESITGNNPDDTEYILSVKTVIQATENFIQQNSQLAAQWPPLKTALYSHSKQLWLNHIKNLKKNEPEANEKSTDETEEYFEYCFDHIYEYGSYPS